MEIRSTDRAAGWQNHGGERVRGSDAVLDEESMTAQFPDSTAESDSLATQPSQAEDRAVLRATARRVRKEAGQTADEAHQVRAEAKAARELAAAALAEAEDMRRAMESRSQIDIAKGMLMALHGFDEDRAFAFLVDVSQRSHRKLRVVAAEIVETVSTSRQTGAVGRD